MAVTFDAVGPASPPQTSSASATLTWTHTTGAITSGALLVAVDMSASSDAGITLTCTYNGVSMTALASHVETTAGAGGGCLYLFGLAGGNIVASAGKTITVTASSAPNALIGGSLSFDGVSQSSPFGTAVTANSDSAWSVSIPSTTSGNQCAGFVATGSAIGSISSGTQKYTYNFDTSFSTGSGAGGISASTGGTVTIGWSTGGSSSVRAGVEVLAGGGGGAAAATGQPIPVPPGLRHPSSFRHPAAIRSRLPENATPGAVNVQAGLATAVGAVPAVSFGTYITGLNSSTGASYFTDNHGQPRMWLGDEIWALITNAGRWNSGNYQATFDAYFATRAAQGYTICYSDMFGSTFIGGVANGQMWDGATPFTSGNPSAGLNNTYWARIDYALNSARSNGITLALSFGGHWDWDVSGNAMFGLTGTQYSDAGNAIGTRYKNTPNLVWLIMDDYFGSFDSSLSSLLTGLRASGDTHPIAIENYAETSSRFDLSTNGSLSWGASNTQFNFGYSYSCTYLCIEYMFAETSPLTPIYGDGYFYQGGSTYQGGTGAGALDRAARQDAWWAVTSGARGWDLGDEALWQWPSSAPAAVSTQWFAANNAGNIRTFMESLTGWQTLAPDTSSALVTAGRGTRGTQFSSGGGGGQYEPATTNSFVSASRTPDSGSGSSLAVAYLPNHTTITIDQTKMVTGYVAFWVDPITGAKTSTTTGTTYNSTAQGSNSQGDPDWVLLLQASTGTTATAGLATGTGTAQQPSIAVTASAGLATGTGTARQPTPAVTATAGLATASGAAQAPAAAITGNAQLATATGTARPPAPAITANTQPATATGTAQPPIPAVTAAAGLATATGTAQQPTVQTSGSTTATAGLAAGTASALSPAITIIASSTLATATGTAQAPAPALSAPAALATGTGTAPSPAPATTVTAGLATGTGAALPPTIAGSGAANASAATATGTAQTPAAAITAPAAAATATGTALTPIPQVTAIAGLATGTGTALQPSIQASGSTTANAQLATAAGTARQPPPQVAALPQQATATGTAQPGQRIIPAGLATATATAQTPALTVLAQAQAAAALAAALNGTVPAQHVPATSTATVTDPRDGTATVTDPRDGTSTITALATSTSSVT